MAPGWAPRAPPQGAYPCARPAPLAGSPSRRAGGLGSAGRGGPRWRQVCLCDDGKELRDRRGPRWLRLTPTPTGAHPGLPKAPLTSLSQDIMLEGHALLRAPKPHSFML